MALCNASIVAGTSSCGDAAAVEAGGGAAEADAIATGAADADGAGGDDATATAEATATVAGASLSTPRPLGPSAPLSKVGAGSTTAGAFGEPSSAAKAPPVPPS